VNTLSDFIGAIKARKTEIALSLADGHASSFEAYQRMVGQYQGLEESLDILNNLMKEDDEHE
jgi:hypothetical protein